MTVTLSVSAADLDDETLQDLSRGLCRDLIDEAGVTASLAAQPAEPGAKGVSPDIGQIIIAAISGGGVAVALVNVLKAYVQRKPSLQFELQKKNGDKVKLKAEDLQFSFQKASSVEDQPMQATDMNLLIQAIKKAIGEME